MVENILANQIRSPNTAHRMRGRGGILFLAVLAAESWLFSAATAPHIVPVPWKCSCSGLFRVTEGWTVK